MYSEKYEVQTEFFEGPLDLLLHLVNKKRMNILDIKVSEITSEYLDYLMNKRGINPSRESDFLMTASTLIYIKSRSLLPAPEIYNEESLEHKLINTLAEYDKIQKITKLLKQMEKDEVLLWKREEVSENFETREFDIKEISSFQLAEVFLNLIKKKDREEFVNIKSRDFSIQKKQEEILEILETKGYLNFSEYIEMLDSIEEFLVAFFSLLDMVKRGIIIALQKRLFDTISVWKNGKYKIAQ
jgi:segregation and condensation protein A